MAIEVRAFRAPDAAAVTKLWEAAFPDDPPWNNPADVIARKLAVQPELFLVATAGDDIAGTVIAGYDGFRGWLHHVAVAQAFQGEGVARKLIEAAEERLAAMGCPKVNLQVRASNNAVRGLYLELGFTEEDRLSFGKRL